ncbi:MAG TPA: peptidoglycan editing factor PgeF [Candidatus Norongarragalinales archaeon]|nr:peptidoglycan editing factor PgeF [Candidatus Norongarragalinales archaeon]
MNNVSEAHLRYDPDGDWYQFEAFKERDAVAAFSTRRLRLYDPQGNSESLEPNRRRFCRSLGIRREEVLFLGQVHGEKVAVMEDVFGSDRVGSERQSAIPDVDAVLTKSSNVALAIHTADCAPLFFLDPVARIVGIAHVGWRGAQKRLASRVVRTFQSRFSSETQNLVVGFGPMIRRCCYEVGAEFKDWFDSSISVRNETCFLDLAKWIREDLAEAGVGENQMHDSGLCTSCTADRFVSYRRDGVQTHHMLSVVKLVQDGER